MSDAIVQTRKPMGFEQLFDPDSCTYTYLLWDEDTRDAVIVDPVDVQVHRDLQEVKALNLHLRYGVNTHVHADHVTGTRLLREQLPDMRSVISKASGAKCDMVVEPYDGIRFGSRYLTVRPTPGHTAGCVSLVADDKSFVLTGDALLINGCGRTDFQGGNPSQLYESVWTQILTLSDDTIVYPAHDYNGLTSSTVGEEKATNPRLGLLKTKQEFVDMMNNLNLAYPKHIDRALPANMRCDAPKE
ncbi:hypothetical protein MPSEU_000326500 [Mayamaea pseudoterrestris]|nr:hypothetical protein MPSEU_000326500 [Mayamaea pseudoterrestris]